MPVLIVKIGRYPLHHGSVGVIRTLGRAGVPVYAITEDRFTPAALSRYLRRRFVWPTTGLEREEQLLEGLVAVGRRLERPALAIPTDDEAAVLLAERAAELAEWFVLPTVAPELPRTLASKCGLSQLCRQHGVPTPRTIFPRSRKELLEDNIWDMLPVVVKNVEPWGRLRAPAVSGTTVVYTADELLALAGSWDPWPDVMLQQYLPREDSEDWIFQAYCDEDSSCLVSFTGIKVRSWPPHAGVTTYACARPNPGLTAMAEEFCRNIAYRGIADMDWRLDRRDGTMNLVDFNPRVGAQFRLFENEASIDVVRAQHLDLTGRRVPEGRQVQGRRFVVEHLDAAARLAYASFAAPPQEGQKGKTEFAWLALDDPAPFMAMAARFARPAIARLAKDRAARSRRNFRRS
jgi:D-aspartate ligase